jgi:hypothetical protein
MFDNVVNSFKFLDENEFNNWSYKYNDHKKAKL